MPIFNIGAEVRKFFALLTALILSASFVVAPTFPASAVPSWTLQQGSVARAWTALASSADGTKLAGVEAGSYIYISGDAGASWTKRGVVAAWTSIAMSSDGTVLAATATGGKIYTSSDSGTSWSARNGAGSRLWTSIEMNSDGTRLAATVSATLFSTGYIWMSSDAGATWKSRSSAGDRTWTAITSSADGTILAATVSKQTGTYGRVWISTDSGDTWKDKTAAGSRNWVSIASSADGSRLAAVEINGRIHTSSDSGATWSERTSVNRAWKSIVSSSDGTHLAAAASAGAIWTSSDSGVTWIAQSGPGNQAWTAVASSSDGARLAAVGVEIKVWTVVLPTVEFDNQGHGTSLSDLIGVSTIALADLPLLYSDTYDFNGWSTSSSGSALTSAFSPDSDTTLYAQWTKKTYSYSITFEKGTATSGSLATQSGNDSSVTLSLLNTGNFVKTGYHFTGWLDENSVAYTDGQVIPLSESFAHTLTAQWAIDTFGYSITFDKGSATSGSLSPQSGTDSSVTLSLFNTGNFVTPGYRFTGWLDENSVAYTDGQVIPLSETFIRTLTAQWALPQSITFTQPLAMITTDSDQALVATSSAGAGYVVSFTSTTPDVCTIVSDAIHAVAGGTCSITASQAGDGIYDPATSFSRTITISKASQSITFTQPLAMSIKSVDQRLFATSSAGSGYVVSFSSLSRTVCTIVSGAIHVVSFGICLVVASQAGDGLYNPAGTVGRAIWIRWGR